MGWATGSEMTVHVLTGQHSREEDVVREGDEATFSQCVKYAVLIGKLLPLLGDLLLIQARTIKNKGEKKQIY